MVEAIRKMMDEYPHPPTQRFDPETLSPLNDITSARIENLRNAAPEMFEPGERFLDIGSCKGYVSLVMSDIYREVVGYEPARHNYEIADGVAARHAKSNVSFHLGEMRDVPMFVSGKTMFDPNNFTTIFAGNVHHYFVEYALRDGGRPFLWLRKFAGMADKYIVIDGPFEMDDPAVKKIADRQGWTERMRNSYTFETFKQGLFPQFALVRRTKNEGGMRDTAVFKRVMTNTERVQVDDILDILGRAKNVKCNRNRRQGVKFDEKTRRYFKFEDNPIPDSVYCIYNSLPEFFPDISVLMKGNEPVGTITDLYDGDYVWDGRVVFKRMVEINRALSPLGILDIQVTPLDYYDARGRGVISIDLDMVRPIRWFDDEYLKVWLKAADNCKGCSKEEANYLVKNIREPDCFTKLKKMINSGAAM